MKPHWAKRLYNMHTVAIIQGRMGSSRLPGKVLLDIAGKPMIQHVIERTRLAHLLDTVIVATTRDRSDDPVAQFCAKQGVPCDRGSAHDVLDRYYQAAKARQAQIVVRITADCPLIDPVVIDETVGLMSPDTDFACNRLPPPFSRTFPIGLDVEVCTFVALERAWRESTETFHREHVMPYLYQHVRLAKSSDEARLVERGRSSRGFNIALLNHDPDYGAQRWTVDTPEDLNFIREIFARLRANTQFTWYDVLHIIQNEPHLAQINAAVRHKTMTDVDPRAP
jgi:spore coat polysaccharide biosynthesis protein SpsF